MPYYAGDYYKGDLSSSLAKVGGALMSHIPGSVVQLAKKALPFAGAAAAGAALGAGAEALVGGGGDEQRRRYRRMNPFNFTAARRAIRRLSSFQKHAQKLYRFVGPHSRFKKAHRRKR